MSNLSQVKLNKEQEWGRKITYDMIKEGAGVSQNVIARLRRLTPLVRIDARSIDGLCRYFECGVGDILVYKPEGLAEDKKDG